MSAPGRSAPAAAAASRRHGAFSCTISGFPDLPGTLDEIAGFFRQMAVQDPQFGMDPGPDPAFRPGGSAGQNRLS